MKLLLVILMEKMVRCRFASHYVIINGIKMNVVKRNGLTSGFEEKVCLIGNCPVSDSFHCLSLGLAVYIQVFICKFNNERVVEPNVFF